MGRQLRHDLAIVLSFVLAVVLLAGVLSVVGVERVVEEVRSANPAVVAAMVGVTLAWFAAWGVTLLVVLRAVDIRVSPGRGLVLYASVRFANSVAPFSLFGGEALAALFVSRATGVEYERCLVAVTSGDVLNYVPAPMLTTLGLVYFAVTAVVGRRTATVSLSALVLTAVVVGLVLVAWRHRWRLAETLVGAVVRVQAVVQRVAPGVRFPSTHSLSERARVVVESLERVAGAPAVRTLGMGASVAGWVGMGTVLWLAIQAVGASVPYVAALFVVSLSAIVDVAPLPGGIGSVDATLVVLLLAVSDVSAPTATAAVVLHRTMVLLLPILLGGVATLYLRYRPSPGE